MTPHTQRRACALGGRLYTILIPEGVEETERDKLCPLCLRLPDPPDRIEGE